jgi:MFS family permease
LQSASGAITNEGGWPEVAQRRNWPEEAMPLLIRLYFNAVFGALGGLLGWMLFAVFGDKNAPSDEYLGQLLIGGAFIGGVIGYFVVSVEALRDRSLVRFCRLASYGVVLGSLGGIAGMWLGDKVNYQLVGQIGAVRDVKGLILTLFARGLGWMFLGLTVGASEGLAARSLGKFSYGTLGGALGGFVGGALFALFYELGKDRPGAAALWSAAGLVILGACIGSLSALVRAVFQPASIKVVRGWQEGREYPLEKNDNWLGRDEHVDIALFRDMRIEKRHALIRRQGNRFVLINAESPPEFTRVNGEPVSAEHELRDGDRIDLGNVILRFQTRAAQIRGRSQAMRVTA